MQPGDVVVHALYGRGTVQCLIAGSRASVRFERLPSLPRTVHLNELSLDGQSPKQRNESIVAPPVSPATATREIPVVGHETGELRQLIEALRLGTVPPFRLKEYTVGREKPFCRIQELFQLAQGMELVFGDYGAGKTHFLDLVEQEARNSSYLTSRVVLDPHETPLSHPQRLWRAIVASLRYPGNESRQGVVPLFVRLQSSSEHLYPSGRRFHRFLSPALWAFRSGSADAWGWFQDYIEGYPMDVGALNSVLSSVGWPGPRALALSDFRTFGRVYVYLAGGLAAWAADAGFRGACLLFDEAEQIGGFDATHRQLAEEVIRHYAAATLPEGDLLFVPDELYRGGRQVHRELPLRFDEEQPLVVLLALTPEPSMLELCDRLVSGHKIELAPLGARHLSELVERVCDLYLRAYPGGTLPKKCLAHAPAWYQTPRELVRELIARLDAHRYGISADSAS